MGGVEVRTPNVLSEVVKILRLARRYLQQIRIIRYLYEASFEDDQQNDLRRRPVQYKGRFEI